jgi:phage-related protein
VANIVEIVVKAVDKSKEGFKESEHAAKEHGSRLKGIMGTAGVMAGGALVAGLGAAMESGMKLQEATGKLKVSVENAGGSWAKYKPHLDAAIGSMGKLGFSSTDATDALAVLTTMTGSSRMGLKSMSDAADLARFKHISLSSAAALVGKAEEGNTKTLRDLGIQLTDSQKKHLKLESAQKRAADVMDLIHGKIKGQADDYSKTAAGAIEVLKTKFENMGAAIGTKLLPFVSKLLDFLLKYIKPISLVAGVIVALIAAYKLWTAWTWITAEAQKGLLASMPWVALAAVIIAAILLIIKYHQQIWTFIKRIWGDIWNFIKGLWDKIWNFAKQWWPLLLGPAGLIWKYHTQIFGFIKDIWNKILDFFKNLWNTIWDTAKNIWNSITGWFKWLFDTEIRGFKIIWGKILDFFKNLWNTVWTDAKNIWGSIIDWVTKLPGRFIAGLQVLWDKMFSFGKTTMHKLWDGLKKIFTDVWGWFKNLPSSILHAIGIKSPPDWAIQAGKHIMGGLLHGIISRKGELLKAVSGVAGAASGKFRGSFGPGVTQWTGDVHRALSMLGLSQSLTGNVLYQMQTESGGDPNAINNWDSNARAGDPSRGLMQTIMSTFLAYAGPFRNRSIYDPMANIYAAINYAKHRYGPSLMSGGMGIGSGHGYDTGGWLPPGVSIAVNRTGRPERVIGPGGITVVLEVGGRGSLDRVFADWIKETVRVHGGGDVQVAFGSR